MLKQAKGARFARILPASTLQGWLHRVDSHTATSIPHAPSGPSHAPEEPIDRAGPIRRVSPSLIAEWAHWPSGSHWPSEPNPPLPSEPSLIALFLAFMASPAQESGNRAALGPPRFSPTLPTRQNVRSCKSNRSQWRNSLLYSPHLMPWNPEMRRIEQTHGKTSAIRWPFDGHSLLTPFDRFLIRIKSTKGTEQTNPPMRYSNTLRTVTSSTGQPIRASAIASKTPRSCSRGLRKTADSNKRYTRRSAYSNKRHSRHSEAAATALVQSSLAERSSIRTIATGRSLATRCTPSASSHGRSPG